MSLIGSRWNGAIVRAMLAGCNRFTELSATIDGISDRMLSERLKELEAEGIVVREVTPSTPVRVEYRLTDKGRALASVINAVAAWAVDWLQRPAERERAGTAT
jgi:DNA-binding HxlR family transcriptional regulator